MNMFLFLTQAADGEAAQGSPWTMWIMIGVMIVGFYFLFMRPQRKRDKEAKQRRSSLEVGDGVTTIGGIVGRVVSIKDDTFLLETGSDRTKIRFQKFAIQDVEKLKLDD